MNGQVKQDADISLMIWKIDEIISKLSEQHRLMPGDIIMTGTPAGVGAVVTGDTLDCHVDGLQPMQVRTLEVRGALTSIPGRIHSDARV